MRPTSKKIHGLLWARFGRYEIRDGYIRPAGRPVVFYEPWDDFGAPEGKAALEQPYHAFLALARRLPVSSEALTAEDGAAICDWCANHGLPGVLQECVTTAVVAENTAAGPRVVEIGKKTGEWNAAIRHAPRADLARIDAAPHGVVDQFSYAIARPLDSFGFDSEPLSRTWTRFFPSFTAPGPMDGKPPYPVPFSDWFWECYAEPLDDFLDAARIFRVAFDGLARFQKHKPRNDEEEDAAYISEQLLWRLTASVHPQTHLQRSRGTNYAVSWVSDSLLGCYAMMAALDLCLSRQIECAKCGSLFISQARQAKYCSTSCRKAAQMNAYRKRQKKGKKHGKATRTK
jgi:hypothetical protein